VKTSSSSKLANGRVHGSGLTNGKSHGPPQRASPIRVVNRQPVSAAAGSTTKRPSVVPSDVTPTPTTSDKLTGLLAKKRKRTEESSSPVRTPASALPPQKVPASQHKNASVIKKRKLEALMHKREENSVWSWRGKSFIKTVYSKVRTIMSVDLLGTDFFSDNFWTFRPINSCLLTSINQSTNQPTNRATNHIKSL
jgi:hypothetical protein